ncbi:hypothetical protein JYU02_01500, partial [bacterium AH-315-P15]|nr:hypothetical protein [bacterium AH-315-P15]
RLSDFVSVGLDFPKYDVDFEIPDHSLAAFIRHIRPNVEEAIELTLEYRELLDIPSITPPDNATEDDYERSEGIAGYVLSFSKLFRRLIELDPQAARNEYLCWRRDDVTFQRLRLWASSFASIASREEFVSEVSSLSLETFWHHRAERDLLLGVRDRWAKLSTDQKSVIENLFLQGPPKWHGEEDD